MKLYNKMLNTRVNKISSCIISVRMLLGLTYIQNQQKRN